MSPAPFPQRIENRIEIHADPWEVFRALILSENLPELVPGIRAARAPAASLRKGDDLDLETGRGERLHASVTDLQEGYSCTLRDDHGTESSWTLRPIPGGTLAVHTLTGDFAPSSAPRLKREAWRKLLGFAADVEEDHALGVGFAGDAEDEDAAW